MSKPRIFVTQPVCDSAIKRLKALGRVTVFADDSRVIPHRTLVQAVKKADILFCPLHDKIDKAVVAANPELRMIAAQSITPSHIDVVTASALDIPVSCVPALTTEATADLTLGLTPAAARRMVEGDRLVAPAIPGGQSRHLLGPIVHGKTFGSIGGGGLIGKAVAKRANGFSMRALYTTPRRKPESGRARGRPYLCFARRIAARIRFRLAAFAAERADPPPDRRARVRSDEEDRLHHQYRARADHRREGAGPRAESEEDRRRRSRRVRVRAQGLRRAEKMKNVVLEPHLGSATSEVREAMANVVVDNIEALLDGRVPPGCVNPEVLKR